MPFDSNLLPSYGPTVARTMTRAEFDASTAQVEQGEFIWITDENLLLVADSTGTISSITTTAPGPSGAYGFTPLNSSAAPASIANVATATDADAAELDMLNLESDTYQFISRADKAHTLTAGGLSFQSKIAWTMLVDGWPVLDTIEQTTEYFKADSIYVYDCPKLTTLTLPRVAATTNGIVTLRLDTLPLLDTLDLSDQDSLITIVDRGGNVLASSDVPSLLTVDLGNCSTLDITDANELKAALPNGAGTITVTGATGITGAGASYTTWKSDMETKGWTVVDT